MRSKSINCYWWDKQKNFGDFLTKPLLLKFCNINAKWSPVHAAQLVAVGSILEHLPENWGGVILGTGKLREDRVTNLPNAKFLAIRGRGTAKGLKQDVSNVLQADLGLLSDHLIDPVSKQYELGLLPHWSDGTLTKRLDFLQYDPLIISPFDSPEKVIAQIGSCKKIVTSSLHGAIVSDSLHIPRRIEMAPSFINNPFEGGVHKWWDYHSSIDMMFHTGVTDKASRFKVEDLKDELYEILYHLRKEL